MSQCRPVPANGEQGCPGAVYSAGAATASSCNINFTELRVQDTVYRLDFGPDTDQPPYEIIVSNPLTALEWVRKGSLVTHRDFLRHCMATGKPFMTLSQSWQLQGPQDTVFAWYPPPGYRKAGWQPDTLDFRQYEAHRKDFLLHAPRARAAGSNGGILW
ncbi:hypothetical protein FIBSPDRAFT_886028 [Athelia psychrophila]|uniref:Uncharacterized protein n=1 Tax=Athelia psychrophila TaxID=1759441 RepID=A0A166RDA5_9AGAM|nr:hypothetical protein FIBSPDRAFT_886028 [Fibularhizoctonia sp. CBS 109695]